MTFIQNTPIKFNIPNLSFRSNPSLPVVRCVPFKDGFATNPLYEKFGTKAQIEAEAKANPRIQELLNEHKIPLKVNVQELEKLKQGHLQNTRVAAAKIYSSLPQEMKGLVNLTQLQEAAMLHDYGKVLIPDAVLNKTGVLNPKEREIMQTHSELGYELLKNKGLDENTLNLIKYHHQNGAKTGYPKAPTEFEYGIDAQILNAADKYTALVEKRSYKEPMSREQALEIIKEDVDAGVISPVVYEAIQKAL